jgi:hypothetical protein
MLKCSALTFHLAYRQTMFIIVMCICNVFTDIKGGDVLPATRGLPSLQFLLWPDGVCLYQPKLVANKNVC